MVNSWNWISNYYNWCRIAAHEKKQENLQRLSTDFYSKVLCENRDILGTQIPIQTLIL